MYSTNKYLSVYADHFRPVEVETNSPSLTSEKSQIFAISSYLNVSLTEEVSARFLDAPAQQLTSLHARFLDVNCDQLTDIRPTPQAGRPATGYVGLSVSGIGVNAAWVAGVATPPVLELVLL